MIDKNQKGPKVKTMLKAVCRKILSTNTPARRLETMSATKFRMLICDISIYLASAYDDYIDNVLSDFKCLAKQLNQPPINIYCKTVVDICQTTLTSLEQIDDESAQRHVIFNALVVIALILYDFDPVTFVECKHPVAFEVVTLSRNNTPRPWELEYCRA